LPVNLSSVGHSSLPPEQSAPTISQSGGPASPSLLEIQTTINRGIQEAAQNFGQVAGADTFTTQTNGNETTVHFGDGKQGARLPSDSSGEADYRTGSGDNGNHVTLDQSLWSVIRNKTTAIR
jgi:hypothetical protein